MALDDGKASVLSSHRLCAANKGKVGSLTVVSAITVLGRVTGKVKALALGMIVAWAVSATAQGQVVSEIRQRGVVNCGVSETSIGFASLDDSGRMTGFDADFCRAVAAAVLGDAQRVSFVPLDVQQRFAALESGAVDVLFRQATWTLTRDASLPIDFGPVVLYDGQGFLARPGVKGRSLDDMKAVSICVARGTTTERNLIDLMAAKRPDLRLVTTESPHGQISSFLQGRCDLMSDDRTALVATRAAFTSGGSQYTLLDDILSREPLAPVVRNNDKEWFDIVKWTVMALILAEEKGITSLNVDDAFATSSDPETRRLLGVDPALGRLLGLDDGWARSVIRQTGNYGEIFERNLGPQTALGMERGLNALWKDGGLLYPMVFQ